MAFLLAVATLAREDARIGALGFVVAIECEDSDHQTKMMMCLPFFTTIEALAEAFGLLRTFTSKMACLVATDASHQCIGSDKSEEG